MPHVHNLSRTKKPCKKHLVWRGNTLCCSKCNEPAGWRWLKDGKVMVYLFPAFKDMHSQIEERPDTHQITSTQDVLGEISFVEFDEFIREVHEQNIAVEVREDAEPEPDTESDLEWADAESEDDFTIVSFDTWEEYQQALLSKMNPESQTEMEGESLWEDQQTQFTPVDTTTKHGVYISYREMNKEYKTHANYKACLSQPANCTLRVLHKNWRSFFRANDDFQKRSGKYLGKPKIPRYLPKDGRFLWMIPNNSFCYDYENSSIHFRLRVLQGCQWKCRCLGRSGRFLIRRKSIVI